MKRVCLVALLGLGAIGVAGAGRHPSSRPQGLLPTSTIPHDASAGATGFSFSSPVRLTLTRNSAINVAVGDANGDGRKDLVLTSIQYDVAWGSLFLQRADGSLAPPVEFALSGAAYNTNPVAFVDLDHDGTDEIVVGQYSGLVVLHLDESGAVSIAENNGARRGCTFLTTGDLNSDGNVDVACHDVKSTITLFYGNGIGGFAPQVELKSSAGNYDLNDFKSLRIADVTRDGRPDLLVTASSVNSFFVHANNGFGGFWPATVYTHPWSPTGTWPAAIQVLDLDGDGVNEVVTASPENQPNGKLNIYRRGASGYLYLSERVPTLDSTTALIVGDVDGDGDDELVAGHATFNAVSVLGADGGGIANQSRFDLPGFGGNDFVRYLQQGHSNGIALGDLNGDGCTDLAGATYSGVILLHGCEPFTNQLPISDFDGDGVSDLLWRDTVTSENYLWQSADIFAWYECALPCPRSTTSQPQATGDFDGDGNSDVFWRDLDTGVNQIWDRLLFPRAITGVTDQGWQVVGAGDFDGDDRSDLLWRNLHTGANTIWKSGNSVTVQATNAVTDLRWEVVGVGDIDGDGRSDILWRHSTSGRNVIWRAGSPGSQLELRGVSNLAWKVAGVGDFNGDGRDDVAWRNTSNGADTIWLSANGATQLAVKGVSNQAWTIAAVGDYNGDGRSDLFWRNVVTGSNVIWRSGSYKQQQAVATFDAGIRLVR